MPFLLECKKRSERRGLIVPILEKSLRKRSRRLFCRWCPMSGKTEGLPKLDYSCFWSVYEKNNPFFRVAGAVAAGGGISGHWLCIPAFYRDSLSRMRNNQSLYSVFTGACGRRVLLSSAILADCDSFGGNGAERRKNVSFSESEPMVLDRDSADVSERLSGSYVSFISRYAADGA